MKTDLKVEPLELDKDMKKYPMLARYDEGLRKLISQVFAGKVILAPSDRAFDLFIDQSKSTLRFPFISMFPSNGYTRTNKNFSASNIGQAVYRAARVFDDTTLRQVGNAATMQNFYQYMYFDIPYQIDCWSSNRMEALQLIQELMFWLTAQGQVKVIYSDNILTCNLTLSDVITDNSTYTEYENIGNLYRFTLTINLEAPVLRTTNYLNITNSELTLHLEEEEQE